MFRNAHSNFLSALYVSDTVPGAKAMVLDETGSIPSSKEVTFFQGRVGEGEHQGLELFGEKDK